nr:N,N-dimethylformamidase beta subunit family domain-containing protein [Chenggangzhangella methanolivorans]
MATNKISIENQLAGNPASEWDLQGIGDDNIVGFATDISVNRGQTVSFKILTDSTNYRIDIYRLGYYGGSGARKVTTIQRQLPSAQTQPAPIVNAALGLVDCGNWATSASWAVPASAVSGLYIAKLVRQDATTGANHIPSWCATTARPAT